jgi:hypothetical protein
MPRLYDDRWQATLLEHRHRLSAFDTDMPSKEQHDGAEAA